MVSAVALVVAGACRSAVAPSDSPTPDHSASPPSSSPSAAAFQKGISYAGWYRGAYSSADSDRSLADLAATGATWISLIVTGYQETAASTSITIDSSQTPSDGDLAHAIATAHSLGLKVMLKPHVDLSADDAHWAGSIGSAFTTEAQWQAWFDAYRAFIDHYARLAQNDGVDQFCIGTELVGVSGRSADWRNVAAGVRAGFHGPITYASNHDGEESSIDWWDAVDYIGVDAYYILSDTTDPTEAQLQAAWTDRGYVARLAGLSARFRRPVLLTEIGYGSMDGTTTEPWQWDVSSTLDLQEQADAYQAALSALYGQPWLAGMFWWTWDTDPNKGGPSSISFTPHGKPAETVLRSFYSRP